MEIWVGTGFREEFLACFAGREEGKYERRRGLPTAKAASREGWLVETSWSEVEWLEKQPGSPEGVLPGMTGSQAELDFACCLVDENPNLDQLKANRFYR